jgi:hypothetical protein
MTRFKFSGKAGCCFPAIALLLWTPTISANAAILVPTVAATQSPTSPVATGDTPKRAQAQANFHASDVDKNERLDLAEFTAFISLNADHNLGQASRIRRFGMYAKAFKKTDANGDGVVTKEEIAAQAQE